jgi:hypothetical protein
MYLLKIILTNKPISPTSTGGVFIFNYNKVMTLEYQLKKAFLEQEEERFIDYLCEPRTKQEVITAIEKIALINLEIKNCEDIIYTANIPECDDPLF